jgi:hypothetical protein
MNKQTQTDLDEYLNTIQKFSQEEIIEMLADQVSVQDIIAIAKERGISVGEKFINSVKEKNKKIIAEMAYARSKELLRRVPRANKFIRVQTIDTICEKIEALVNNDLDSNSITNTTLKALDLLLRAHRQIAEETNDISPVIRQTNNYLTILEQATPEERQRIVAQAKELKRMVENGNIIDVEFKLEGNE